MSTCAHCRYEELSRKTADQMERAAALVAKARIQQALDPSGRAGEVLVGADTAFAQLSLVMQQIAMAKELGVFPSVCSAEPAQADA